MRLVSFRHGTEKADFDSDVVLAWQQNAEAGDWEGVVDVICR